ncbi:YceI family protein [Hymenobacter sp. RP-2-7]|uniref:YceI family protein n=1 Tax=Hymenobacter polaris TaxID=2682546 RepID=A0A7Y0AHX3_9BACT|nr:YceI family protein [Hymenobacter polaris]NML67668.1 YceI family protein [Hymenobacter polaris]
MATTWLIDPMHSEVQFKVKHLVISTVTGSFNSFAGSALTEGDGFENGQVEVSIQVDSVNTSQDTRDQHLRGEDFFDAGQYPTITFKSTSFTKKGGDEQYTLSGDLTIKGITKPVTLDVEHGGTAVDFYGNTKAGFEATGKINRKEFGLTWGGVTEAGAIVVGEDVKLIFNIQLAKQAEVAAA